MHVDEPYSKLGESFRFLVYVFFRLYHSFGGSYACWERTNSEHELRERDGFRLADMQTEYVVLYVKTISALVKLFLPLELVRGGHLLPLADVGLR